LQVALEIFVSGHVEDNSPIIIKKGQSRHQFLLNTLINSWIKDEQSGMSVVLLYFFFYFVLEAFGVADVSLIRFV